jgi:hypothetical protein
MSVEGFIGSFVSKFINPESGFYKNLQIARTGIFYQLKKRKS